MEYVTQNLSQTFIIIGLVLLSIEIFILGFSTFFLFFFGCSALIVGALVALSIIPNDIWFASGMVVVVTAVVAAISWKPLKNLQNDVEVTQVTNDIVGQRFFLEQDIEPGKQSSVDYSGIQWVVGCAQPVKQGSEVEITHISVGRMTVQPVQNA